MTTTTTSNGNNNNSDDDDLRAVRDSDLQAIMKRRRSQTDINNNNTPIKSITTKNKSADDYRYSEMNPEMAAVLQQRRSVTDTDNPDKFRNLGGIQTVPKGSHAQFWKDLKEKQQAAAAAAAAAAAPKKGRIHDMYRKRLQNRKRWNAVKRVWLWFVSIWLTLTVISVAILLAPRSWAVGTIGSSLLALSEKDATALETLQQLQTQQQKTPKAAEVYFAQVQKIWKDEPRHHWKRMLMNDHVLVEARRISAGPHANASLLLTRAEALIDSATADDVFSFWSSNSRQAGLEFSLDPFQIVTIQIQSTEEDGDTARSRSAGSTVRVEAANATLSIGLPKGIVQSVAQVSTYLLLPIVQLKQFIWNKLCDLVQAQYELPVLARIVLREVSQLFQDVSDSLKQLQSDPALPLWTRRFRSVYVVDPLQRMLLWKSTPFGSNLQNSFAVRVHQDDGGNTQRNNRWFVSPPKKDDNQDASIVLVNLLKFTSVIGDGDDSALSSYSSIVSSSLINWFHCKLYYPALLQRLQESLERNSGTRRKKQGHVDLT